MSSLQTSADNVIDSLKEQQRVSQLALTMQRYRSINSPTMSTAALSQSYQPRQTPNPFSSLPPLATAAAATASYTPSLTGTDFIPGLSGQNIYDPNLTADEIRQEQEFYLNFFISNFLACSFLFCFFFLE